MADPRLLSPVSGLLHLGRDDSGYTLHKESFLPSLQQPWGKKQQRLSLQPLVQDTFLSPLWPIFLAHSLAQPRDTSIKFLGSFFPLPLAHQVARLANGCHLRTSYLRWCPGLSLPEDMQKLEWWEDPLQQDGAAPASCSGQSVAQVSSCSPAGLEALKRHQERLYSHSGLDVPLVTTSLLSGCPSGDNFPVALFLWALGWVWGCLKGVSGRTGMTHPHQVWG